MGHAEFGMLAGRREEAFSPQLKRQLGLRYLGAGQKDTFWYYPQGGD